MRRVGRIAEWNDARGFGFVEPSGGGARAFLHIKAIERRSGRPVVGALVSYEIEVDEKKRPRAAAVRFVQPPRAIRARLPWRSVLGASVLIALLAAKATGRLPAVIVGVYGVASVLAFAMYWFDKSAALKDRWRTPEKNLHLIGLLGGWPGALIAQDLFRHKSRKLEFQIVFWLHVAANLALVAWLLKSGRMPAIERGVDAWFR